MRKTAGILVLLLCTGATVWSQALPPPEMDLPEEYDPDEFALWAHDLRRFEVVTVGSFPVTFFATSLIYDFSIYAANDFSPEYGMGTQRSSTDIAVIIGAAAITSLVIATIDLIINVNRREKAESASAGTPYEP